MTPETDAIARPGTEDAARAGGGTGREHRPARGRDRSNRVRQADLQGRGEPWQWGLGGALALGVTMVAGLLALVLWNGLVTFWPGPIDLVRLRDGSVIAGEPSRSQPFRPGAEAMQALPPGVRAGIAAQDGWARRTLYRTGNFDLYGDDFRWVPDYDVRAIGRPRDLVLVERLEWGVFVGRILAIADGERRAAVSGPRDPALLAALATAQARWTQIRTLERGEIGAVNHYLNDERLRLRRAQIDNPDGGAALQAAERRFAERERQLKAEYDRLSGRARALRAEHEAQKVVLADAAGTEKAIPLGAVVRFYPANDLSFAQKVGIYLSRWAEFLLAEPREANTEGGVMPAIFGTFAMTLLLVLVVTPLGVVTALYLREYAKQGRLVSVVRISVNNLAGVPSIVYGVFGLGFFAYIVGGTIDQLVYPERLPNPTFGTGGLLWSSLTLALLTVPVVIVATEEALAAVPRSMREGSLACGASKWQTIRRIVLPRAMPGIMTGVILAMARGAGEVAPLMLVGVVKLAPELPIDGFFPFVHLERSFMHLGFHIFDVGFQSRNSEAGKPMVFVTTLLLIALVFVMNLSAILIRNRLKRKYQGSQF